jgi:membrane dipeptidase
MATTNASSHHRHRCHPFPNPPLTPVPADGHNDLAIVVRFYSGNKIYTPEFRTAFADGTYVSHTDLARMDAGHYAGAFWSAFWPCTAGPWDDDGDANYAPMIKATLEQLDLYHRLAAAYPATFAPTPDGAAAERAFDAGRGIAPLIIEGLHQIANSAAVLRMYHALGVRYATLSWNCHNAYVDAALEARGEGAQIAFVKAKPYWEGVSPAGRDIVREINRLGMLVDLSHVSADTMRDVLGRGGGNGTEDDWEGSLAPPIFSHSSVYALCPHPRNVPDDVLELVRQRGALVMINFTPEFISCEDEPNPDTGIPKFVNETSTLETVVKHIVYIGEKIGYEYVGIGTDYDGMAETPRGLEDVTKFPVLVAEMLRQGVTDEQAALVVGRNLLRVWKEADRVAAELQKTEKPLEDDVGFPFF